LSCEVVIEYKGIFGRKKFCGSFYYGYSGKELKAGDEVYFEEGFTGLKVLFKKNR
jgi:hypothetical protein